MLFSTFKNIEKCPFTYWLNGRWFLQIVDRDSGNLYPIYIYTKIVVLASEPVGGKSRATKLPCFDLFLFCYIFDYMSLLQLDFVFIMFHYCCFSQSTWRLSWFQVKSVSRGTLAVASEL